MIILLIGPTSVGKSSLGKACARRLGNCKFKNLDTEIRNTKGMNDAYKFCLKYGFPHFFQCAREIVGASAEKAERLNEKILVDCGEGILQMPKVSTWLAQYTTVCLVAPTEQIWKRIHPYPPKVYSQWAPTVYTKKRMKVFLDCDYVLNVRDATRKQAEQKLLRLLQVAFARTAN
jgi:shikimate kinase